MPQGTSGFPTTADHGLRPARREEHVPQWISAGGTSWAMIALLVTLEPKVAPASLASGQQLIAAFLKSPGFKKTSPAVLAQTTPPLAADKSASHLAPSNPRSWEELLFRSPL